MVSLELHEFWCSFTRETKPLNKRGVGQVKMVGFLNLAQLACFGQLALGGDSWGNYSVRDDSPPKLYTLTCRSLPSCTNHILHNFQMKSLTQETKSSRLNKYTFTLCIYLYHVWLCHHVLAKLCDIDNIIVYNLTLALRGKITITIFCETTWCKLSFAFVTKLLLTLLSW